jgi:hypothetical protein
MFGIGTRRDWLAMILILFAVPLSVFGGTNIACVGQGLSQDCSYGAVFISPLLLIGAGIVAGLITSGWTGLLVVGFGQIMGQVAIVALSYLAGNAVPIDWFSGIVATVWFGAPIAIGYGLARAAVFLVGRRRAMAAAEAAAAAGDAADAADAADAKDTPQA